MAEIFDDVTEQAIEQANQLLAFLVERSNPEWEAIFAEALGEAELELNQRNVVLALERLGIDKPYGAVLGGTGMAKQEAGLEGEDSQRAVRLLKQSGRLLQAGKGRGKALLVLNAGPLQPADFAAAIAAAGVADPIPTRVKPVVADRPDDYVAIDDVGGLLKAAHAGYRALESRHEQLTRENAANIKRVTELEAELQAAQRDLEALREEFAHTQAVAAATHWQ